MINVFHLRNKKLTVGESNNVLVSGGTTFHIKLLIIEKKKKVGERSRRTPQRRDCFLQGREVGYYCCLKKKKNQVSRKTHHKQG